MTTLKERFEEKFYQDTDQNDRVSGWLGKIHPDNSRSIANPEDLLSFFQQELLALAEELDAQVRLSSDMDTSYKFAAALIRSKAESLL